MAIGAKIGAPHRPVIAVAGDGGIMFTVNELATAAEERLALPVIVWNNDALKEIVDQMDRRQIPRIGVEPRSPDFLRLAQGLGCHAAARGERRAPGAIGAGCAGRGSSDADRGSPGQPAGSEPSPDAARADGAPGSGR